MELQRYLRRNKMCHHKGVYNSVASAVAQDKLNRKKYGRKYEPTYPYLCPICDQYHLTSVPRKPNETKSPVPNK